jgi:chromosomal replication initiation ATPase DnaA
MAEQTWNKVMELQGGLRKVAIFTNFHEQFVNVKVVKEALQDRLVSQL